MFRRVSAAFVAALSIFCIGQSDATTFSNVDNFQPLDGLWSGRTNAAGDVFNAPGGTLESWSYTLVDSRSGTFPPAANPTGETIHFGIAEWSNGIVGADIYSSSFTVTSRTTPVTVTFSNIGASLTAGTTYIAYLSMYGNEYYPIGGDIFDVSGSTDGGGLLTTNAVFSNSQDPYSPTASWITWGGGFRPQYLVFSATFSSAVPELSTWAMMIVGFCGLGFITYRRKATALTA